MLFNSLQFMLFFPLVVAGYFLLPHSLRWLWLVLASCYFYMAYNPMYIFILFALILIDYSAGILFEKVGERHRKKILVLSLGANLAILCFFKYFNFVSLNVHELAKFLHWNYSPYLLSFALPIGLSFHTFQSMSYTIEVYRGNQKPERHLGIYALYVLFFPQLVAGPIERPQNLLEQFRKKQFFDYDRVTSGLKLMLWGFFKKVVIADRVAQVVNLVYDDPAHFEGPAVVIATVFFAIQIFCDFSGYSDIAIGSARVLGIRLMTNFDRPYSARSVSEFWRRWHISLSTWFKDYLYIPLGGNRVGPWRVSFNLMLTFIISGLWHGANWTYIVWGGLNGLYLVVGNLKRKTLEVSKWPRLKSAIDVTVTFALICFAWIFFRAKTMGDAWMMISSLGRGWSQSFGGLSHFDLYGLLAKLGLDRLHWKLTEWGIALASILFLEWVQLLNRDHTLTQRFQNLPVWVRWPSYYAVIFTIIVYGKYMLEAQFIYFQF